MPVFDFSGKGTGKAEEVCTYIGCKREKPGGSDTCDQ